VVHVAHAGEIKTAYTLMARKPESKDTISENWVKKMGSKHEHMLQVNIVCGHGQD
jgi:hypothetical protein